MPVTVQQDKHSVKRQRGHRSFHRRPMQIAEFMQPYEERLSEIFDYKIEKPNYTYPWNRKFEVEIDL